MAAGTVTALDSLFPAEESRKASARVHAAIGERAVELRRLHDFDADNSALSALVARLPDDLSHDIMVPFGGAAFFPGRLIHTNEFLVLLGEGYYVERTAKQTLEILQRRGKFLEDQMGSLRATMQDLEAEAQFFDSTADESAEGLVEIREAYIEESEKIPSISESSCPSAKVSFGRKSPPLPLGSKENAKDDIKHENFSDANDAHVPKIVSGFGKAFTGSVVEHAREHPPMQSTINPTWNKPSASTATKPVSRFKLQKGNR